MELKHSKGPFYIELDGTCSGTSPRIKTRYDDSVIIAELETCMVCIDHKKAVTYQEDPSNWKQEEHYEEIMANATLLGAADEMVHALIKSNGIIQKAIHTANEKAKQKYMREALQIMDEAIKKATGKSNTTPPGREYDYFDTAQSITIP